VLPQDLAAAGLTADIECRLGAWRPHCGGRPFKIIVESGMVTDACHLRAVADAAIAGGADMLKTSTGKGPPGASMAAAAVFCQAVLACERAVGIKLSGGIRTTSDAGCYLSLIDALMGVDWVQPNRLRFGASGLLTALLADLGHPLAPNDAVRPPATPAAY
jgi:deoxyribose-phosphate aldolase